ncbi:hypothetical protein pb186bvf_001937 [Paramecium bursaria]
MNMDQEKIVVQITNNLTQVAPIKVTYLRHETNMERFLQMSSQVLKIKAKRIFDLQGREIRDVIQIENNGNYVISQGENFQYQMGINRQSETKPIRTFNLSILGMGSVGKSNITMRWVRNQFYDSYDPTFWDTYTRSTIVDDKQYEVKITDTCGQEDYAGLRMGWMKEKDGIIFAYAINSLESFKDVQNTLELYKNIKKDKTSIVIVGNKMDLEIQREVPNALGQQLAQENDALFYETSAKFKQNRYSQKK